VLRALEEAVMAASMKFINPSPLRRSGASRKLMEKDKKPKAKPIYELDRDYTEPFSIAAEKQNLSVPQGA
jgi:hypothetical protein